MNDNNDDDNECYGYEDEFSDYDITDIVYINDILGDKIEEFCNMIKSKYGYAIAKKDVDYSIGNRNDYVKIPAEIFTEMLLHLLTKNLTGDEIAHIIDMRINMNSVGCRYEEFPIEKIYYTDPEAVLLSIEETCSEEIEKKIDDKMRYYFKILIEEIKDLYYQLKDTYYTEMKG